MLVNVDCLGGDNAAMVRPDFCKSWLAMCQRETGGMGIRCGCRECVQKAIANDGTLAGKPGANCRQLRTSSRLSTDRTEAYQELLRTAPLSVGRCGVH